MARGLDPFGDGSLIESFSCENLLNDQGTRSALTGTPTTFIDPKMIGDSLIPTSVDNYIPFLPSLPIQMTSSDDWSISFTLGVTYGSLLSCKLTNTFGVYVVIDESINEIRYNFNGGAQTIPLSGQSTKFVITNDTFTNTATIYVDNVPIETRAGGVTISVFDIYASSAHISVIDELLFFNRSLTTVEIALIYVNYLPPLVPLELNIHTNVCIISTMPVFVNFYPLLNLHINNPIVNNQTQTTASVSTLKLNITQYTILKSGDNLAPLPLIIEVESPLSNLNIITPNFTGFFEPSAGTSTIDSVKPQSIPIPIVALYLQAPTNTYIDTTSMLIELQLNTPGMLEYIYTTPIDLQITVTSSIANPYKDKRVSKIGSVSFDKALYWSQNKEVFPYITTSQLTINNDSVVSIHKYKKFNRSFVISTETTMSIDNVTLDTLINEINESNYDIIFNDGSFETVKNDLLSKPIVINPIYEGANRYYIEMRVLL